MARPSTPSQPLGSSPPGSWPIARKIARRAIAPVERFLQVEAASGIILVVAAAAALVLANSPWADSFAALWHTRIGFEVGPWHFERDLHFWINDGLMAIFFFVVGLEIRREIDRGVLSSLKRAALPLGAALGGVLAPAGIYLALNAGLPSQDGWGVPMATDIAFAVGVMALLGKRVPPALRILLLALAVIDDLAAILVIAIFYSSGLSALGFAVAAAGIVMIIVMRGFGVRHPLVYFAPALVVWGGTYAAGVHPTLAGVIIGLMTPVRIWIDRETFVEVATAAVANSNATAADTGHAAFGALGELERAGRESVSPADRLEHALHPWVAYLIMPLFALANAGVPLGDAGLGAETLPVFGGIMLGLVFGKPVGVLLVSWLIVRLGLGELPPGIGWRHIFVVGLVAGIGFTMALFIAQLALPPGPLLETGKLSVLIASGAAAVIALSAGRMLLRPPRAPTEPGDAETVGSP